MTEDITQKIIDEIIWTLQALFNDKGEARQDGEEPIVVYANELLQSFPTPCFFIHDDQVRQETGHGTNEGKRAIRHYAFVIEYFPRKTAETNKRTLCRQMGEELMLYMEHLYRLDATGADGRPEPSGKAWRVGRNISWRTIQDKSILDGMAYLEFNVQYLADVKRWRDGANMREMNKLNLLKDIHVEQG